MPPFNLTVISFSPPQLPDVDLGTIAPSDVRAWDLIPAALRPTSSMRFTVFLPEARDTNPLHPASHLQIQYLYEETNGLFAPDVVSPGDLIELDQERTYEVEIIPSQIARCKVNHGASSTAEVAIYAWKGERLLGRWAIGQINGLGLEGFKSTALHKSRVANWKASGRVPST